MDILIIKLGAIGDVLRTTAALPGLKERHPDSRIEWLTRKNASPLLEQNSDISQLWMLEEDIPQKQYDWIICLDDEQEACEIASRLANGKITGAYLDKEGNRVYTEDARPWFDMGLISRFGKEEADRRKTANDSTYQELIYKILGLEYHRQEPSLQIPKKENAFAQSFSDKYGIQEGHAVIGFNTGAGGRWKDKRLSIEEAAFLIDAVRKALPDAKLILFGGPEEKERNRAILKKTGAEIIDAGCDNSLLEFSALVDLCTVLVTSDSLALHIGVALKKKVVAFFYPTSAAEIELYGRGEKLRAEGSSYCSYQAECDDPPRWDIKKIKEAVLRQVGA